MKRYFLSIVALLLVAVGAYAEETVYTIKLAGQDLYFTTNEVVDNAPQTTYSLSATPEKFYITPSGDGFIIQSAENEKYVGHTVANSWDFSDDESVWYIGQMDGTVTTITKDGTKGFGVDKQQAGAAVFTDKANQFWQVVEYTEGEGGGEGGGTGGGGEGGGGGKPDPVDPSNYAPSASTQVYDQLALFGDGILDLFSAALDKGRKYPTDEEFAAYGIDPIELNFVRSHVRPRSILLDHSKDINQSVQEGRRLWMNIPFGIGKNQGGYPNTNAGDDTFTGWNYTHVFGAWNNGLFHAPSVLTDAGHKHGTDVYSGIKFFESWTAGSGASGWVGKVQTKDPNRYGGYKYVEPLINALMYFGQDGINYNFEDSGYAQPDVIGFHQAAYALAKERGFHNFHIGIYTAISVLDNSNVEALLGKDGKKTADAFLNYASSDFQTATNIQKSISVAKNAMGSCEDVYQGTWIVGMNRSWTNLSKAGTKPMNIVLWGEHAESRLHSYNAGNDAIEYADNYQKLQERFFSGGYRNPATRPAETNSANWQNEDPKQDGLRTFQGMAHYIPERTTLQQNLPFLTHFCTGSGDRYNYKGKKTAGSWYNVGAQDYQPTYRWLVYKMGTTTAVKDGAGLPEYTIADAYTGGTCLRLTNTEAVDIQLYRGELTCSAGTPKATLALKRYEGAPAGTVSVIVKKKGSDQWLETPFQNVKGSEWEEQTVALQGVAQGDVIEYWGLRANGNTQDLLVGKLELSDDARLLPAGVKDLLVDVKEETQVSLSVKLAWGVEAQAKERAAYDLLYNDEANIDHFEVLYKNGEEGRVSEIGRTTSWATYVGNILMAEGEDPYIGVRSVSVDGKSYSNVVWVHVPRAAASELPAESAAVGSYPLSQVNDSAEGFETARSSRWFKTIKSAGADENIDLSYTANPSNDFNYHLVEKSIKAQQGQSISLTWTDARAGDGLNYCTARGYADWDRDYNFNAAGDELIWSLGASNSKKENTALKSPYTITFKIPEDAVTGESRVRLVFSDAWFPHPGATGLTAKGFTIDVPLEITGTNSVRQPAVDTHDQGIADEPAGLSNEEPEGIYTTQSEVSRALFDGETIALENVDKVWVIATDGRIMNYQLSADAISTRGYAPGTYMIRMQQGAVIRTAKILVK